MTPEPELQADVDAAVNVAFVRQMEVVQHKLNEKLVETIDDCRDLIRGWTANETLVLDLDMNERIQLLEDYGDEYGLELTGVSLRTLRDRIDAHAAFLVGALAEIRSLEVIDIVEQLLEEHDLDVTCVRSDHLFGMFSAFGERDEPPWYVYEYRNIEGENRHVDLFEYEVGEVRIYVVKWLTQGNFTTEEETWDSGKEFPPHRRGEILRSYL